MGQTPAISDIVELNDKLKAAELRAAMRLDWTSTFERDVFLQRIKQSHQLVQSLLNDIINKTSTAKPLDDVYDEFKKLNIAAINLILHTSRSPDVRIATVLKLAKSFGEKWDEINDRITGLTGVAVTSKAAEMAKEIVAATDNVNSYADPLLALRLSKWKNSTEVKMATILLKKGYHNNIPPEFFGDLEKAVTQPANVKVCQELKNLSEYLDYAIVLAVVAIVIYDLSLPTISAKANAVSKTLGSFILGNAAKDLAKESAKKQVAKRLKPGDVLKYTKKLTRSTTAVETEGIEMVDFASILVEEQLVEIETAIVATELEASAMFGSVTFGIGFIVGTVVSVAVDVLVDLFWGIGKVKYPSNLVVKLTCPIAYTTHKSLVQSITEKV